MIGIVLLVAAGLLAISYHVFCREVDERSYEHLWMACNHAKEVLSDSMLWDMRDTLFSYRIQTPADQVGIGNEIGEEGNPFFYKHTKMGTFLEVPILTFGGDQEA